MNAADYLDAVATLAGIQGQTEHQRQEAERGAEDAAQRARGDLAASEQRVVLARGRLTAAAAKSREVLQELGISSPNAPSDPRPASEPHREATAALSALEAVAEAAVTASVHQARALHEHTRAQAELARVKKERERLERGRAQAAQAEREERFRHAAAEKLAAEERAREDRERCQREEAQARQAAELETRRRQAAALKTKRLRAAAAAGTVLVLLAVAVVLLA